MRSVLQGRSPCRRWRRMRTCRLIQLTLFLPERFAVPASQPIPILMYHQIDRPPAKGAPFRSLTVHPVVFARHMRWLQHLGFRGLSMRDLMPYLRGEARGKVFGLTFDDGFRNVHQNVIPVLRDLGFTATCYFVAAHPGGTNFWDAAAGVARAPLMDDDEIRDWVASGHEAGSHTLDHVDLTQLDEVDAKEQIVRSRQVLEEKIQEPVEAFCYPYGRYHTAQVALVREAGYVSATTTQRGRARPGDDLLQLHRVPVVRSTHFAGLVQKLVTAYEDRRGRHHTQQR